MDALILENIRCFHGRQVLPLAPLTVLIGENSTGKSTVLAAARLAWDIGAGMVDLDFNEEPFDWGAYDQIAHYRGGRGGRAKSFVIGFQDTGVVGEHAGITKPRAAYRFSVEAKFTQHGAQPGIRQYRIRSAQDQIVATYDSKFHATVAIRAAGRQKRARLPYEKSGRLPPAHLAALLAFFKERRRLLTQSVDSRNWDEYWERWEAYGIAARRDTTRPCAIAPLRSRPQRTYDPRREAPRPEGDHVPMILARLKAQEPQRWEKLREALREFGVQSGLFRGLGIKRLGSKESAPFQLNISIAGPPTNLIDVGYGVSQVLPIAVDCLTAAPRQIVLMQQPEVHLHPRAQAALGSFLGFLAKTRQNRFIIETHSDYLVDRLRLDVRDGKNLKPEDVVLLYFEREGIEVKVHPIRIDRDGNLVDAPPGYRRFFLEEEERFFGRAGACV